MRGLGLEGEFDPVNYPEGYDKKPWCPYTKVVELGAQLAGIPVDPEKFCGLVMTNAKYSRGALPWLESADYDPRTACISAHMRLISQLESIEKGSKEPNEKIARRALANTPTMEGKGEILDKYRDRKVKAERRIEIISRWRRVLLEEGSKSGKSDKNPHFEARKVEEITDGEIIETVVLVVGQLKRITGYEPLSIIGMGGAQHCNQSPKSTSFGKKY